MPIDVTKPVDGVDAVKADLRANLVAAAAGIAAADLVDATTAVTINAAKFGDHAFLRLRCLSASAIAVTLANDVPAGKMLEIVQYGVGLVTVAAGAGATLVRPAAVNLATVAQYDAMVAEVDTNAAGNNAGWRMVGRT